MFYSPVCRTFSNFIGIGSEPRLLQEGHPVQENCQIFFASSGCVATSEEG